MSAASGGRPLEPVGVRSRRVRGISRILSTALRRFRRRFCRVRARVAPTGRYGVRLHVFPGLPCHCSFATFMAHFSGVTEGVRTAAASFEPL